MAIKLQVLNSTGILDSQLRVIEASFRDAKKQAVAKLGIKAGDIVVQNNPGYTIPELGIGGFTDAHNSIIYISLDISHKAKQSDILACLCHEFYHLKRHAVLGVPVKLQDRLIDEGLACLFEYESTGMIPIYAQQKLSKKHIKQLIKHLNDEKNIEKWFFGSRNLPKWIGYTYGFDLAKHYVRKNKTNSTVLLNLKSQKFFH